MQGIFTTSRNDFYDYLRCPKIVALKIHRNLIRPPLLPKLKPERNIRYEIGTIGEVTTKEVFSEKGNEILEEARLETEDYDEESFTEEYEDEEFEFKPRTIESPSFPKILEVNLSQKGVQLDTQMKSILRDTLSGLKIIRKYLEDEYGEVRIVGRGQSKNGVFPGTIKPDFVAIAKDLKKPLLIEVKNSSKINQRADNFQASFYNSIAKKHGVLVLEERMEDGQNIITPKLIQNITSETLLVYPRLGEYQKISDTVKFDQKIIDAIWQAKQLGLMGKTPHTDCDSSCPHHKLGELPEDNVEPAIPLPLIYAQGLRELGKDLDIEFLRRYIFGKPVGSEFSNSMEEFREKNYQVMIYKYRDRKKAEQKQKSLDLQKEKYLDLFAEKTGFSRSTIEKLSSFRQSLWKDDKKIIKEMKNEIHPWQKIIGQKKFKLLNPTIKGITTKIYSIPDQSNNFIKKSWKEWS